MKKLLGSHFCHHSSGLLHHAPPFKLARPLNYWGSTSWLTRPSGSTPIHLQWSHFPTLEELLWSWYLDAKSSQLSHKNCTLPPLGDGLQDRHIPVNYHNFPHHKCSHLPLSNFMISLFTWELAFPLANTQPPLHCRPCHLICHTFLLHNFL